MNERPPERDTGAFGMTEGEFLKRVKKTRTCWLWAGRRNRQQYGVFSEKGKNVFAHRWAYANFRGPIAMPFVCHKCDNPPCVNPKHLFLGDARTNGLDMGRKGRSYMQKKAKTMTHCKRGHKYTGERKANGNRICRPCLAILDKKYYPNKYKPKTHLLYGADRIACRPKSTGGNRLRNKPSNNLLRVNCLACLSQALAGIGEG